jgi:Zn ribbon nucleic-acid-binding protein
VLGISGFGVWAFGAGFLPCRVDRIRMRRIRWIIIGTIKDRARCPWCDSRNIVLGRRRYGLRTTKCLKCGFDECWSKEARFR